MSLPDSLFGDSLLAGDSVSHQHLLGSRFCCQPDWHLRLNFVQVSSKPYTCLVVLVSKIHFYFRTILRAVLPSPAQVLPDSVLKTIRKFTDDLVSSMHTSLEHLPANLIYVKLKRKKYVSESQQFI